MTAHLLVAARDPGAANVLAGFLTSWNGLPRDRVKLWGMGKAIPLLKSLDLQLVEFDEDVTEPELAENWRNDPPAMLLTGSSHYTPFEAHLWNFARRDEIEALCWIDYWSHLGERFRFGKPPSVIALDEGQARALRETGFDRERIIVGGHPALKFIASQAQDRAAVPRPLLGGALKCLFISERFHGDVSDGLIPYPGFDEFDSFKVVYEAATEAAEGGQTVDLTVKFHPYENPERFRSLAAELPFHSGVALSFRAQQDRLTDILPEYELAFGMCSIGLIEALFLGIPAKSVQPGRTGSDLFPPAASGFVPGPSEPAVLRADCVALMRSPEVRATLRSAYQPFLDSVTGSTEEIECLIEDRLGVK